MKFLSVQNEHFQSALLFLTNSTMTQYVPFSEDRGAHIRSTFLVTPTSDFPCNNPRAFGFLAKILDNLEWPWISCQDLGFLTKVFAIISAKKSKKSRSWQEIQGVTLKKSGQSLVLRPGAINDCQVRLQQKYSFDVHLFIRIQQFLRLEGICIYVCSYANEST